MQPILSSSSPALSLAKSLRIHNKKQRTNYLRRKINKTLTLKPSTLVPSPKTPPLSSPENEFSVIAKPLHLNDAQNLEHLATVATDPFSAGAPARHSWLPEGIAGLALRFVALIAVQTAVAVWFIGGRSADGENGMVMKMEPGKEERRKPKSLVEVPEFELKVLEIRAMAREAREKERRDLDSASDEESEILVGIKSRLDSLRKTDDLHGDSDRIGHTSKKNSNVSGKANGRKLDYKRKIGYLNSIAKISDTPKGFGKSKSRADWLDDSTGGARHIKDQSSMYSLHEAREPEAKVDGVTLSSSHITVETQNSSLDSASCIAEATSGKADIEGSFHPQNNNTSDSDTTEHQKLATLTKINGMQHKKPPSVIRNDFDNSSDQVEYRQHAKENDASQTLAKVKPWWLQLPYVLAIFLHRGVKREDPKGLYSLQIGNENAVSYTVVFQDRGDATNFCYLLEAFFEELNNVSADVVPMTVKELQKAVESKAMNVLVVKKGQLNLYAGQPLTEVETALRTLVH